MQKFFTETLQSKFIQGLLYNTPLLTLQTVREDDYIINGHQYVYYPNVIRCTSSGKLSSDASYDIIGSYTFGEYIPKMTYRYMSSHSFYDSETHYHLGKYLRMYRDCLGIDLMPFYNCFSNRFSNSIRITEGHVVSTKSTAYKCALVPIKLNKKYTICIDCPSTLKISPVYLNSQQFVSFYTEQNEYNLTDILCDPAYSNQITQSSTSFKQPIHYSLNIQQIPDDLLNLLKQYEDYLYLVIQFPFNVESSLCVLEGDYSATYQRKFYSVEGLYKLNNAEQDNLFLSTLQLMQMSDGQQLPYSPRLVEYLLNNVVTPQDDFWKNVYRVQEVLGFPATYSNMKGVWDVVLRANLFRTSMYYPYTKKLDLTGYYDKDVENQYQYSSV